jgi:hypothetical protein
MPVIWLVWIAATIYCGVVAYGRRLTFRCRGEKAITISMITQTAILLLLTPPTSNFIGGLIHSVTGQWNLEVFAGGVLCFVADASTVYHAAWRVYDQAELQRLFHIHVELPATVAIPLMFAFFEFSGVTKADHTLVELLSGWPWLALYWLTYSAGLIYILSHGVRAANVLRRDPRSTAIARIYLGASYAGIGSLVLCSFNAVFPQRDHFPSFIAVSILGMVSVTGYALAAGLSWRRKQQALKPRCRWVPSMRKGVPRLDVSRFDLRADNRDAPPPMSDP